MTINSKILIAITISLLAMAFVAVTVPEAAAAPKTKVYFTINGFTGSIYSNTILTIDGTPYTIFSLPSYFNWDQGSTHTIAAFTPFTSPTNQHIYKFSSWTNGGSGLTTSSGTYTVPAADTTVTANYVQASHYVTFATSGFSGSGDDTLIIDGTTYKSYNFYSQQFRWEDGSSHTVQALPVHNYDNPPKGYTFSSWTNGNGLTTASGTFTMPNTDVTVTANYVQSTVQVTFAANGLSNQNGGVTVLIIDGITYDYFQVALTNFQWEIGSQHTVSAASSVTGLDSVTKSFSSWTNGNGLTTVSGTFTTPSSNVAVTVNYGDQSTTAPTTLTVTCNAESSDRSTPVTISGTLTSSGSPVAGKTVTLSYFVTSWITIGSATTQPDGTYTISWTIPADLPNGEYPVQAAFAGDSSYQSSQATTGSGGENGPILFVTPEAPIGGIVALIACFGGAAAFFKLRGKHRIAQ